MEETIKNGHQNDYRKHAINAAKDFGYGQDVIDAIKEAKDDNMISGIMKLAREKQIKDDFKRGLR